MEKFHPKEVGFAHIDKVAGRGRLRFWRGLLLAGSIAMGATLGVVVFYEPTTSLIRSQVDEFIEKDNEVFRQTSRMYHPKVK